MKGESESFTWKPKGDIKIGSLPDIRTFTFFKLQFVPKQDNWWRDVPGIRELARQRDWQGILENLARQGMIPVTPALKNHLRFEKRWSSNTLPHWFFGTQRGDQRVRSKISFSWAHHHKEQKEWIIRGWAYLPQDNTGRRSRDEIGRVLQETLAHPQGWFQALGVGTAYRSAHVTFAPEAKFGQLHIPQQVADLLNSVSAYE
jgi:CRISPR-associated protein Cmr1